MKSPLRNEQGAVLIIELVVLAVVLAAAGFAAYQYTSHKNAANQAIKAKPHVVAKSSTSPSPTATPTPTPSNVFTVKELGIQFTVTPDIRDLVYTSRINNGISAAYFSSLSLEAADKNAGGNQCTLTNSPVGAIDLNTFTPGGSGAVKMIGGKYLNYTHPQWMCSTNSSVMNLANQQIASFMKALQTAEAIPK